MEFLSGVVEGRLGDWDRGTSGSPEESAGHGRVTDP